MNKSDMVKQIEQAAGLDRFHAEEAFDAIFDHIGNALARGENVQLIGFGSFVVNHRAERNGRNPQTGESITIAAHKVVGFKAGSRLKNTIHSQK